MSHLNKEIQTYLDGYKGKVISRAWQGHGSAIFLELGKITDDKGELTVMIEWSWRVEKDKQIHFGSWSSESRFPQLETLEGLEVLDISFQSRLPEIVVKLSEGYWVCSFSTVEGDPEWALIGPSKTLLSFSGEVCFEHQAYNKSLKSDAASGAA